MTEESVRPHAGTASHVIKVAGQIRSVQGLRAVAALCVVGFHSSLLVHDWFDPRFSVWENGNSGVDLFFVISGFIMALSTRRLRVLNDGWRRFAVIRLIRIAPMYWIATLTKLAVVAVLPSMALHTRPTRWNIVASFLFLPSRNAAGYVRPILDVGWTLSFEVVFYVIFAIALFLGVEPLIIVGPTMAAIASLSFANDPTFPALATLASPIMLEFVFGLIVGRLASANRPAPTRALTPCLIGVGFVFLLLVPSGGPWARVGLWGLPASAVLYGSVTADRWIGRRIPNIAVTLGEASYSLYLTHGFVIPLVGVGVARSGLRGTAAAVVLVGSTLMLSCLAALVTYRTIEVPVTNRLRQMAGGGRYGRLAAPQAPL